MRVGSFSTFLDKTAISLSAICVVHCLTLPIALALLPSLALLPFGDESFHQLLVYLVIPTSVVALTMGCRKHRQFKILAWGGSGVVVMTLTAIFGHDLLGEFLEKVATIFGATLVAIGHVLNFRSCQSIDCHAD